jgi:hypothetical protein
MTPVLRFFELSGSQTSINGFVTSVNRSTPSFSVKAETASFHRGPFRAIGKQFLFSEPVMRCSSGAKMQIRGILS